MYNCGYDIVQGRKSLRPMSGEYSNLLSHYDAKIVLLGTGR